MTAVSGSHQNLKSCLRVMLSPVVRICLRHSLHLGQLIEILKEVFVDCARVELEERNEPTSLSKLSIMTGVHRKDVTKIIRAVERQRPEPNLISRIMVQWQHHPDFTTRSKRPRVLGVEGRSSQFAELIRSVNGEDLSAYSVLNEMLRLGAIEKTGGRVRLCWRDFVANSDSEAGIRMLSHDLNQMALAVEENLFGDSKLKNLHLKTEFDNIPHKYLLDIKAWLLEEGSQFHRRTREFLCKFDRDTNPDLGLGSGTARVVMGTFSLGYKEQPD